MGDLVHTSHIRIVQQARPLREAYIENFREPVRYGVHSNIAAFYGLKPPEEVPATLDHIISATGG